MTCDVASVCLGLHRLTSATNMLMPAYPDMSSGSKLGSAFCTLGTLITSPLLPQAPLPAPFFLGSLLRWVPRASTPGWVPFASLEPLFVRTRGATAAQSTAAAEAVKGQMSANQG